MGAWAGLGAALVCLEPRALRRTIGILNVLPRLPPNAEIEVGDLCEF